MEMCVDGILYYYEVYTLSVDRSMYGHMYYVEYIKKNCVHFSCLFFKKFIPYAWWSITCPMTSRDIKHLLMGRRGS